MEAPCADPQGLQHAVHRPPLSRSGTLPPPFPLSRTVDPQEVTRHQAVPNLFCDDDTTRFPHASGRHFGGDRALVVTAAIVAMILCL